MASVVLEKREYTVEKTLALTCVFSFLNDCFYFMYNDIDEFFCFLF